MQQGRKREIETVIGAVERVADFSHRSRERDLSKAIEEIRLSKVWPVVARDRPDQPRQTQVEVRNHLDPG